MRRTFGAVPLLLLWTLPLVAAIARMLGGAAGAQAWRAALEHPQLWPALGLSLLSGAAATLLSLICTLIIAAGFYRSRWWDRLQSAAAVGLALPHLAFAIGFGFLIMPSGIVARLAVGGDTPPHWVTTQDPLGLSLVAALALKEIPFLFAMVWAVLSRGDAASSLAAQWRAARSLGHAPGSVWLRIVQPQLLKRLVWPLAIVFAYGATVIDMALVIGPTQPPTLAIAAWHDLNDAEPAMNARGLALALILTLAISMVVALTMAAARFGAVFLRPRLSSGPSLAGAPRRSALTIAVSVSVVTVAVHLLLAVMSAAPRWPYPLLWPAQFGVMAWATVFADPSPLLLSLAIAVACSGASLLLCVLWFETQAPQRDRWLLVPALIALVLPQIALAAGQYRLLLWGGMTGTPAGLFLVHLTPALAYAAIVLAGPYRAFDARYAAAARSLKAGPFRVWTKVKVPLLKSSLALTGAVAFAVSFVQFVPAQLAAAGRYETLPMSAVTLSSGANRPLLAAFALMLALPPLLAFALAAWLGRPRWG